MPLPVLHDCRAEPAALPRFAVLGPAADVAWHHLRAWWYTYACPYRGDQPATRATYRVLFDPTPDHRWTAADAIIALLKFLAGFAAVRVDLYELRPPVSEAQACVLRNLSAKIKRRETTLQSYFHAYDVLVAIRLRRRAWRERIELCRPR